MAQTVIHRNVTQVLRTLLLAHGERQEDVATALGVTQAAVSNKMAGKTKWSLDDIAVLAEHFGLEDPSWFLSDPVDLLAGSRKSGHGRRGNYDGDVGTMSQNAEFDVDIQNAA